MPAFHNNSPLHALQSGRGATLIAACYPVALLRGEGGHLFKKDQLHSLTIVFGGTPGSRVDTLHKTVSTGVFPIARIYRNMYVPILVDIMNGILHPVIGAPCNYSLVAYLNVSLVRELCEQTCSKGRKRLILVVP